MEYLKEIVSEPLRFDISKDDNTQYVVNTTEADHSSVTLINNAGFGLHGAMEDRNIVNSRPQIEGNCFGSVFLVLAGILKSYPYSPDSDNNNTLLTFNMMAA